MILIEKDEAAAADAPAAEAEVVGGEGQGG